MLVQASPPNPCTRIVYAVVPWRSRPVAELCGLIFITFSLYIRGWRKRLLASKRPNIPWGTRFILFHRGGNGDPYVDQGTTAHRRRQLVLLLAFRELYAGERLFQPPPYRHAAGGAARSRPTREAGAQPPAVDLSCYAGAERTQIH